MRIAVKFKCRLEIIVPCENYTGKIVIWVRGVERAKEFYFLFLRPYDPIRAEIALYEDEQKLTSYGEALGRGKICDHPLTRKPVVLFDFGKEDVDKIAILFVATSIISEAIHHSESDLEHERQEPGKSPYILYEHIWEQDFSQVPHIGRAVMEIL